MATQEIVMSADYQYMVDLTSQYEVCTLLSKNLQAAIQSAKRIVNAKVRDKAVQEIVRYGASHFQAADAKMAIIVDLVSTISDEKVKSKCAARLLNHTQNAALRAMIVAKNISLAPAEKREKECRASDEQSLIDFREKLQKGDWRAALVATTALSDRTRRLEALKEFARALPADFPFELANPKYLTTLYENEQKSVGEKTPGALDNFVKITKRMIIRAAAEGHPALSIAIQKQLMYKSAGIENALHRAANITATYNMKRANEIVALITLPRRLTACWQDIDAIGQAKAELVGN